MNKDKIRVTAEIIAVVSVVFSLLFVGFELRLSRDQAYADSFAITYESMSEFENLITDNVEVWRRGCLGEELSIAEEMTFARLVLTHNNLMRTLFNRISTGITQTNQNNFPFWVASSRYRFSGYDSMYRRFQLYMGTDLENVDLTNTASFIASVERNYQELIETQEDLPPDVAFCGF